MAGAGLLFGILGIAAQSVSGQVQAPEAAAPEAAAPSAEPQKRAKTEADAGAEADSAKEFPTTLRLATGLDAAAQTMREHLKKMRTLAVKYHLSDTPAETKSLQAEWIKMLESGRKVHRQMVEAAMEDYRAAPDPDSETAAFLYQVAARNADTDRFDGMLEVVKLLQETGFTIEQFDLCFGLTSAAENEFEAARPHLQRAMEKLEKAATEFAQRKDVPDDERQLYAKQMIETHGLLSQLSNLEYYQPLWEEEQKRREADATGEPLPRVLIETTKGSFEVELFEDQAPNTVANFVSLCEQNFYDGLPFHRVLTHFMAQGGCPNRDGSGGPGYTIRTELGEGHRNFFRGTLGMAMTAQPDSGGSQFFVCYLPRAHLDGKYVAFGRVIEGMNVLSDLTHVDPQEKDKGEQAHEPPDEIIRTKVVRKREHAYVPEKISPAK